MENPRIAPSRCVYCDREPNREKPSEIPYVTPTGEGVCQTHQDLLNSVGIQLDRVHRHEVSAYRAFAETPWRYVATELPSGWTHDPKHHKRTSKENRSH